MASNAPGFSSITPITTSIKPFNNPHLTDETFCKCRSCGGQRCDLRVQECGCTLHTRCFPLKEIPMTKCPCCGAVASTIYLFPLRSPESEDPRYRKRPAAATTDEIFSNGHGGMTNHRTGRWTMEEMSFTDEVVKHFDAGTLPVPNGLKLVDFLSNVLFSKPSRLTKKLKNAKLSTKCYKRTSGHVCNGPVMTEDNSGNSNSSMSINPCLNNPMAASFSRLEDLFLKSLPDNNEVISMRFMLSRHWRDWFSQMCFQLGQPLHADAWLNSIEELEQKAIQAIERAKHAKRRLRMGYALQRDSVGSTVGTGVFIQGVSEHGGINNNMDMNMMGATGIVEEDLFSSNFLSTEEEEFLLNSLSGNNISTAPSTKLLNLPTIHNGGAYLEAVMTYIEQENISFEYLDVWVPSFVSPKQPDHNSSAAPAAQNELRLCCAGYAVRKSLAGTTLYANLVEFGEYSIKFSFRRGHGLPGRVFDSGMPNWEQRVDHAPSSHFERCGGASLYGIKTVLGMPVQSASVGRIVVALYSLNDVAKDSDVVVKLTHELTKWNPLPKWKLTIDIAEDQRSSVRYGDFEGNDNGTRSSNVLTSTGNNNMNPPPVGTSQQFSYSGMNSNNLTGSAINTQTHTKSAFRTKSIDDKDSTCEATYDEDEAQLLKILAEHIPVDSDSNILRGFMSLRLLLLKSASLRSPAENELLQTMKRSYRSYKTVGRKEAEVAQLLAKDCIFLLPQQQQQSPPLQQSMPPINLNGSVHQKLPPSDGSLSSLQTAFSTMRHVSFSSSASSPPLNVSPMMMGATGSPPRRLSDNSSPLLKSTLSIQNAPTELQHQAAIVSDN